LSAAKPRYEVLWTETARTEIARFIAHDSVENALAVLDRLEQSAENLAFLPERGRFVPELKQLGVLAYREIIVRPWRIIYRFDADRVYVLGVPVHEELRDLITDPDWGPELPDEIRARLQASLASKERIPQPGRRFRTGRKPARSRARSSRKGGRPSRETFPSWCTNGNLFILIFGSAPALRYEVEPILQYRQWARPLYQGCERCLG
jgi:toxin ParE1/3/4